MSRDKVLTFAREYGIKKEGIAKQVIENQFLLENEKIELLKTIRNRDSERFLSILLKHIENEMINTSQHLKAVLELKINMSKGGLHQ